jgi:hypothetical protein
MEPWSIVAEHPDTGEPYGIVMEDDSTFAEAEDIARQLLATCRLLGSYVRTNPQQSLHGSYLFVYRTSPGNRQRLATIWATSIKDAELRLNILAAEGILFMPSPG